MRVELPIDTSEEKYEVSSGKSVNMVSYTARASDGTDTISHQHYQLWSGAPGFQTKVS